MIHLCNVVHPDAPNARRRIERQPGQTIDQAIAERRAWLADKIVGPPHPAHWFLSPVLAGVVGVYQLEEGESPPAPADGPIRPRLYRPAA